MKKDLILFKDKNSPRPLEEIIREIAKFKDDYINTTRNLILDSVRRCTGVGKKQENLS
jgi:hypothetical protein